MGKYLRLRLNIDISKPLCRGRVVSMAGNEKGWVDFRYERLPIFCFWCGKLDHDDRDYPLWIESKESLVIEERQFGPWLRAELGRLQRPQVAEANRKNKGEGKSKEETHQSNTRDSRHNWRSARMAYDNIVFPLTPKEATKVSDLDMADVTPQGKKLVNFEEQLREIDSAINDDVTIQELTGFQGTKEGQKVWLRIFEYSPTRGVRGWSERQSHQGPNAKPNIKHRINGLARTGKRSMRGLKRPKPV